MGKGGVLVSPDPGTNRPVRATRSRCPCQPAPRSSVSDGFVGAQGGADLLLGLQGEYAFVL